MAVYEGTFTGKSRPHTLRLTVNQTSQDIAANTSQVSWTLEVIKHPSWASYSFSGNTWSVTINGTTWSGSWTYDFRSVGSVTISSSSLTVAHESDGTKTISSSATAYGTSIGTASCSGSLALTTIPRASTASFDVAGTPVTTIDAGDPIDINTNRLSASFTHTVEYAIGAASGTIATDVTVDTSWTPPLSLLEQIPNSASGTITITLKTYSGLTLIGTKTTPLTLTAPSEIVPDFTTVTVSENVTVVGTEVGAYVKLLSRLNLAITGAAGTYGSTIASYKIEVPGTTINAVSGVSNALTTSGTVTITGTITDSRGRVKVKTVNITVLNYAYPVIDAPGFQVRRSNVSGVVEEEGTYLRVDLNASVSSLINSTERNELTYKISTRLRGAGSWTLISTVVPGGVTFNSFAVISPYAVDSSWEVQVQVLDKFATAVIETTVATATIFMHWGDGLGVGKFWEQGALDVLGQIYQNDGTPVLDTDDISTNAETQAGSSATKLVTPASLATLTATTSRAGLAETATAAEVRAGTDTSRFVTPSALSPLLSAVPIIPTAALGCTVASDGWVTLTGWDVRLQDVFSAEFDDYVMMWQCDSAGQVGINLQLMDSSNVVSEGVNYDRVGNTTQGDSYQMGQNFWYVDGGASGFSHAGNIVIYSPFLSDETHFVGTTSVRRSTTLMANAVRSGYHRATSSFTGFRFTASNGSSALTGRLRVLGIL